ncbi:hypothetical protein ACGC1H_006480 [Rhizoctonia solani]
MENVDDADAGFTDIDDYDIAVVNQAQDSSFAPAPTSVLNSKVLSGHSSSLNRQNVSRIPTSSSQLPDSTPVSLHSLSSQTSSRAGAPLTTQTPAPPPPGIPPDLQTMSTLELRQRLLIPNYKKLVETLSQIIDDPNHDRFVLNPMRKLLTGRISAIEAAIVWRSSFKPSPSNALNLEAGSGVGSLGGPSTTNHVAPTTSPIPGPLPASPIKKDIKCVSRPPPSSHVHFPSPTTLRVPSHESIHPRLSNKGIKLPSSRRPLSTADGKKPPVSRFISSQSATASTTDLESFGQENDDPDIVETRSSKPSKAPPLATLSSFGIIQDDNVTTRSPRKRCGLPTSSRSVSSSKTNSEKEPMVANVPAIPLANVGSDSSHPTRLIYMETRQEPYNDPGSESNTSIQIDEEQSTSIYKDEIMDKLKSIFGLEGFRTNQARAVDATMSGRDVFVLMPTGGGKSLCYQLPAVCTGKTKGVTFVVSPLKSLMEDQVRQLRDKGIDVVLFNSDQSPKSMSEARTRLVTKGTKPSLVYITPEKLQADHDMRQIINKLMQRGELARFVIDEAHCISTWGRDFRPAYEGLGFLRQSYPGIPIMALTATANSSVQRDIVIKLGLTDCVELTQSFNRPNLHYEVLKKGRTVVTDIARYLCSHHPEQTGVIYCLSRDKCEKVAKELRDKYAISARHYHARMAPKAKSETLGAWISGDCKVIVATIAFGMGIDKPNVRFVIHQQMPMSLSSYYQETGRAGRDGKPAQCILYYRYKDRNSMDWMIEHGDKDRQTPLSTAEKKRQKDEIRQVVQYCQNTTDCRRSQVLEYFGERFNPSHCYETCDNCISHSKEMRNKDMTEVACMALELVQSISAFHPIMNDAIDAFRGSKRKEILRKGFNQSPMFGKGSRYSRELVERLFHHLLSKDALKEEHYQNGASYTNLYIVLGECADDYLDGRKSFMLPVSPAERGTEKHTARTMSASNKYRSPSMTWRTVARKFSATSASRPSNSPRSGNHLEGADRVDSDDANDASEVGSESDGLYDIEETDHFLAPPNSFDDPETKKAQGNILANVSTIQTTSVPTLDAPDSDVEDGIANMERFDRRFRRLKQLCNNFQLEDPDNVLYEEVLQELALLDCTDEQEFKHSLRSALRPNFDFEEKLELFGKSFMDLCLTQPPHTIIPKRAKPPT